MLVSIPNRGSRPAVLLRESYREVGKVRNRTLASLTAWPREKVEAPRQVLRGGGGSAGAAQNAQFKDARVDVFVRVGSSQWVKMAETPIERRIGSHAVDEIVAPEDSRQGVAGLSARGRRRGGGREQAEPGGALVAPRSCLRQGGRRSEVSRGRAQPPYGAVVSGR